MTGHPILLAVSAFLATFAAHVGIWRLARPRGQIRALAPLFCVAGPAAGAAFGAWRGLGPEPLALQVLLHLLLRSRMS